jgi:hypothetical protein
LRLLRVDRLSEAKVAVAGALQDLVGLGLASGGQEEPTEIHTDRAYTVELAELLEDGVGGREVVVGGLVVAFRDCDLPERPACMCAPVAVTQRFVHLECFRVESDRGIHVSLNLADVRYVAKRHRARAPIPKVFICLEGFRVEGEAAVHIPLTRLDACDLAKR